MVFVMAFFMVRINDRTLRNFIAFHINILVAIGEIQATEISAERHVSCFAIVYRLGLGAH